jgi:hypothetical protein
MRLKRFRIVQGETRLLVQSESDVTDSIRGAVARARSRLKAHIQEYPDFKWSLEPLATPPMDIPGFVREMYAAGRRTRTGPFSSVAGALASEAARAAVAAGAASVLVENGGDICLYGNSAYRVAIHAGSSTLSDNIGLKVCPGRRFAGVCTSSSELGESLSFGEANAVVVHSPASAITADAAATAVCNHVRGERAIDAGLGAARSIGGIGVVIVRGEEMGAWGNLPEIIRVSGGPDITLDPGLHSRAS